MLEILAETLGQTPESLLVMMIENERATEDFMVMLNAVETYHAEKDRKLLLELRSHTKIKV